MTERDDPWHGAEPEHPTHDYHTPGYHTPEYRVPEYRPPEYRPPEYRPPERRPPEHGPPEHRPSGPGWGHPAEPSYPSGPGGRPNPWSPPDHGGAAPEGPRPAPMPAPPPAPWERPPLVPAPAGGPWRPPRRVEPVPGTPFGLAYLEVPRPLSGPGIGAMVAGIASLLVTLLVGFFGSLGARSDVGALVGGAFGVLAALQGGAGIGLGVVSLRQVRRLGVGGRGMAVSGIVCGAAGVVLTLLIVGTLLLTG